MLAYRADFRPRASTPVAPIALHRGVDPHAVVAPRGGDQAVAAPVHVQHRAVVPAGELARDGEVRASWTWREERRGRGERRRGEKEGRRGR